MTDRSLVGRSPSPSPVARSAPSVPPAPPAPSGGLERCLAALADAADAADTLGLDTAGARATHADAIGRLGLTSEAYVLALIGGTGVGKSSLLNALAGESVSPASARRPTTESPIAWIPAEDRDELAPLLDWLGITDIRVHDGEGLRSVAILDLPDMDSTAASHRARVEALLPRIDGVAWVTDPEKYHDAALHDGFLRTWVPRLDRQAVVLNKSDRLDPRDLDRVRRDLERDVAQLRGHGSDPVAVLATSARPPDDGAPELDALRAWLAEGATAKSIVRGRLAATIVEHARRLADDAGIDPGGPSDPILDATARRAATDAATTAVLRAVDLVGLERQAVAATRARARARGTGPMGMLTSLVYRWSGRETRVADPEGFLVRWRDRASLAPAIEALRMGLQPSLAAAAPRVRPAVAAALEPTGLRRGLEGAVDAAIARRDRFEVPSSRWWSLIGLLQTITTAVIVLAVAWIVVWILARPAVDLVEVPVLGRVPIPLAALVVALVVGYVLARLVGWHAGWLGRRWAHRLRDEVSSAVEREIRDHVLGGLDRLEAALRDLVSSTRAVMAGCGDGELRARRPRDP